MSDTAVAPADPAVYDALRDELATAGPVAAVESLCRRLREAGDYGGLFYALLMKKRLELGVNPVPTGPAAELPEHVHAAYEDAIREAGREVGHLFLAAGDLPRAWNYFRMLGEPGPIKEAINRYTPSDGEDAQPIIDIAFQQGVCPEKGFDLILDRYGICSSITMVSGYEFPHGPEVRAYCVRKLTRALTEQLKERLRADIAGRGGELPPESATVAELIAGRDELFADDLYHVDTSHLSAVTQMAPQMPIEAREELALARDLCRYGKRLAKQFQYPSDPPFDDFYGGHEKYLSALLGEDVEANLAHFRAAVEAANPDEDGTYAAEVLVNLLLKLDRPTEALAVAKQYLAGADERQLSCPGVLELCQRTKDYASLAEASKERNDPVHYLAGLIAAKG